MPYVPLLGEAGSVGFGASVSAAEIPSDAIFAVGAELLPAVIVGSSIMQVSYKSDQLSGSLPTTFIVARDIARIS